MATRDCDQNSLINDLIQWKELVNQLRSQLSPSSTDGQLLIQKILFSFDKALSQLNYNKAEAEAEPLQMVSSSTGVQELQQSDTKKRYKLNTSTGVQEFQQSDAKKRKMLHRTSEQVRMRSESGLEGGPVDGYSWRKYGQKELIGAKQPRVYYRCTHRNAEGCLATKQVQRCDDDPCMFDVTYRAEHTCVRASHMIRQVQSPQEQHQEQHEMNRQKLSQVPKAKTKNLGTSSSFSFPTSASIAATKSDSDILSSENNLDGSFSPSFISPAACEPNCFSPIPVNSSGNEPNFQNPKSVATSSENSLVLDMDFEHLAPLSTSYWDLDMDFNATFLASNRI